MTKRELNFCEELAILMCEPSGFEVGGFSSRLKEVIKTITAKNAAVKKKVLDICEERVESGYFDSYAYETKDPKEVMRMIKEDYDTVFFKV